MNKHEVIEQLCALASKVGGEVFEHQHAHDCFCGCMNSPNFEFSPLVLKFIEDAVNEKISNKE